VNSNLSSIPEQSSLTELDHEVANLSYSSNILTVKLKNNIHLGEGELENLLKTAIKFTDFKKYYAVIDTRALFTVCNDIRQFYSESKSIKYRYADAFIIDSLAVRLLVNFYISFNKPLIPTKTFTNLEDAMLWINELKQANSN